MSKKLYFNQDPTEFCGLYEHYMEGAGDLQEGFDRYLGLLARAGVTDFLCNVNAERTNYDSAVWEPFWFGFDPEASDDQPFFEALREKGGAATIKKLRRRVEAMLDVHQSGVAYPERMIAACRRHGVTPWISVRMNDVHVQENEGHPNHGSFWRNHPELRRQGYSGYYGGALDYGHREVRDHYERLIGEVLDRFDGDGLELDFLREPYLFSKGMEAEGAVLLTGWLGRIRELVDGASARRGRPVALAVRVPSRPEVALKMGLDAPAWAREGLIDTLVVGPRWATLEYAIPMREWQEQLAGADVQLVGGLEVLIRPYRSADQVGVTPEEARGAAAQLLHDGSDGVYLFNYFPTGSATGKMPWWSPGQRTSITQSIGADAESSGADHPIRIAGGVPDGCGEHHPDRGRWGRQRACPLGGNLPSRYGWRNIVA